MAEDRCICCGEVIPEGRMVCPNCMTASKAKTRLIDADMLKANFPVLGEFAKDLWHAGTIRSAIDNAPTVDAVEVVHGQWEQQQGLYSCSECGKTCPYDVQADTIMYWTCNYCPNCGAKMDGERKDNERKAD